MGLGAVALANMRRHKGRVLLMMVGVAVSVATCVAITSLVLGMRHSVDGQLARYGASLVVTPSSPELSLDYGGVTVSGAGSGEIPVLESGVVEVIRGLPSAGHVAEVVPVLLQPLETAAGTYLTMGTDIPAAVRAKPWWKTSGAWPAGDQQVVLGASVAEKLHVSAGDSISLQGEDFVVSGLLEETGGEEDNLVIMNAAKLAELTGRAGELNLVEVTATDTASVDRITQEIAAALPEAAVASVKKTLDLTVQTTGALAKFGLAAAGLASVVAGIVVALTMMASVRERQREIGVFRTIGFRRRHIVHVLLVEVAAVAAAGAVVGAATGLAGVWLLPRVVDGLTLSFTIEPVIVGAAILFALALSLLAASYPVVTATRMNPAEALKTV